MMTLTVAQFKAIVLILTLVVAMGCSGGKVEEQSEVGESLGLQSDESGEQNDDDVASDVASDSLGHRPLKLVIKAQGGDRIIFWGLHKIGVDCRNNGEYEKGAYLSCRYEADGIQQINIVSEYDSDEFWLNVLSERKSSYFVSLEDQGDFRDGWSIFNLLQREPDSDSIVGEKRIDMDSEIPLKLTYKTHKDDITVDIHVLSVFPDIANYAIDCDGDGVFEKQYEGTISSCRYSKKGSHQIALIGRIPSIRLFDDDEYSLLSVDQWGTNRWRSMHLLMANTSHAVIKAKDAPDLSHVKDMSEMFKFALKMNSDINHWDVSHVTNMQGVFFGAKSFNRPLDKWDTSNVVNMTQMFALAEKFNQDINQWNVSNVRYMSGMFYKAKKFDQLLDKWDVSKVEYMADMFAYTKYNRPLRKWNIASLLDPCGMFEYSTDDKYVEGSLEYYFKDIVFQYKVYYKLKSIGRDCDLDYNHRTDPWRDPEESDYYPYFKDDHDVYRRSW